MSINQKNKVINQLTERCLQNQPNSMNKTSATYQKYVLYVYVTEKDRAILRS